MRTLLRSSLVKGVSLCLLLLLLHSESAEGLRMRGDQQLPGEAAKWVKPSARFMASSGPEGRIAGGNTATIGDWPAIVSIQNQFGYPFCNGAIIDDFWVLTAASCVSGLQARNLLLLAGTVASWNNTAPGYYVDQIHIHCNFDKPLYHNDIALLHLSGEIEYNTVTANISLSEIDELEEGEKLSFAGWGTTSTTGSYQLNLQQSEGTYLPVEKCRSALGDTEDVDLGHVCVQMDVGKGLCHGDAGGPLINEKGQLVGIANWGVPCGLGRPDVYARVAFYNDWIRTIINGCGIV